MNLAYKIALFCGLMPLILAVIILSGWFITGEVEFLIAGLFNIAGGVILFVIGICCLLYYEYQHRQNHQVSAWRKLLKPFLILIVNFPAAAACMYLVFFMMSVSVITVDNQTKEFISAIKLNTQKFVIKPILGVMPGDTIRKYRRFTQSGPIGYSFEYNGRVQEGTLIKYVSRHNGINVAMTISNNGSVSIEEKLKKPRL